MTENNPKVLLVEDDPSVLFSLEAYLDDEDFNVIIAETGEKGVEKIASEKPDVGIIDMRLPGIDGNAVIIRGHELHPNMKFIVLTGSFDYIPPKEIEEIGVGQDNVLNKPLRDMNVVVERIRKVLAAS